MHTSAKASRQECPHSPLPRETHGSCSGATPASRSPPPSPRAKLVCPLAERPGVLLLHHCHAPKKPLSHTQAFSAAAGQRRSRGRHSLRHRPPARPMRLRPARPRLGTSRDTHAIMTVWPHAGIPERSAPSCFCKETMQVWLRMCMVRVSCWQWHCGSATCKQRSIAALLRLASPCPLPSPSPDPALHAECLRHPRGSSAGSPGATTRASPRRPPGWAWQSQRQGRPTSATGGSSARHLRRGQTGIPTPGHVRKGDQRIWEQGAPTQCERRSADTLSMGVGSSLTCGSQSQHMRACCVPSCRLHVSCQDAKLTCV